MAVAALVMGILALVLCWVPIVNWILAALGIIFGAVGMVKGKRVGRGRGLAITGLLLSVVGVVIGVVLYYMAAQRMKAELEGLDIQSSRATITLVDRV
jgi:outer membrane lipoprotein SlyB